MRAANLIAGATTALWFGLFLMGRDLARGVYLQGPGVAPNAGQIDYYIIVPASAVMLLLLSAWAGNIWRKPIVTLIPSCLIGFAILPFLTGYTGGV
ncbi:MULTISPECIES: hypothetical protein [Bacteria]|uniref:hypothetical protein n=1 Tax=Bacteria TaxID=2 RepID=UPI0010574E76|nr:MULTISPECIES: hypothetical protein [Bacteria]